MKKTGLLFVLVLLWSDYAAAQTPYFEGKTIRIIVGYPAGSAHDLWGRLIAPYINKNIPRSPATVVQHMPGGRWSPAAQSVDSGAEADGQAVDVPNAALYFEQLVKRNELQFDWSKFSWVGSMPPTSVLVYRWGAGPYKTVDDVVTA